MADLRTFRDFAVMAAKSRRASYEFVESMAEFSAAARNSPGVLERLAASSGMSIANGDTSEEMRESIYLKDYRENVSKFLCGLKFGETIGITDSVLMKMAKLGLPAHLYKEQMRRFARIAYNSAGDMESTQAAILCTMGYSLGLIDCVPEVFGEELRYQARQDILSRGAESEMVPFLG